MGLQPHHAVDHVDALALEGAGPADVALLVEARLQLDEYRDVLAVGRGLHQLLDGRRVAADAVQRLLDGEHVRVVGGGAKELHHWVERVVRVVKQHVPVADGGEQLAALETGQRWGHRLHQRRVLELGPVDRAGAPETAQAERRAHGVEVLVAELEVLREDLAHVLRHGRVDR